MRRAWGGALVLLALATSLSASVPARAAGPVTSEGYIPMPDGARLHYILYLPSADGRFPTLFKYDQYSAGSPDTPSAYVAQGYAVIGVNLRGSGCSSGIDSWIDASVWGRDGADVVEWIAAQSWSDQHVGMFGGSFPGLSQLGVAGFAPPHLDAIAPAQPTVDFYRDIAYPGGIYNEGWMSEYPAFVYNNQRAAIQDGVQNTDTTCGALSTDTQLGALRNDAILNMPNHPYLDDYWSRTPSAYLRNIHVPVLGCQEWQDGAVGSRATEMYLDGSLDPDTTWLVGTNGTHGNCNIVFDTLTSAFFERYVKGVHNGWESTPHVILGHELHGGEGVFGIGSVPAWTNAPAPVTDDTFYLHPDGRLDHDAPAGDGASSYAYPLPSSSLGVEEFSGYENVPTWQVPDGPGGSLTFTTPALAQDEEFFGSGAVRLFLASTATDTDVQVTLTEVRADGMETYVERGWLRLSHRAEDPSKATPSRPFHLDTAASAVPLVPGTPVEARVELMPFDHVFAAGSSLRLTIEAPTGTTFGDVFDFLRTPAQNTIVTSAAMPSSMTLQLVPGGHIEAARPNCLSVIDQPCRVNLTPVPVGQL